MITAGACTASGVAFISAGAGVPPQSHGRYAISWQLPTQGCDSSAKSQRIDPLTLGEALPVPLPFLLIHPVASPSTHKCYHISLSGCSYAYIMSLTHCS